MRVWKRSVVSYSDQLIPRVRQMTCPGLLFTHIVSARQLSVDQVAYGWTFDLYSSWYAILAIARIRRRASEDVILELVHTECMPACITLRVGACPLHKADACLDFVVYRFSWNFLKQVIVVHKLVLTYLLSRLFCGAGHEKRRGDQLKWSWHLGCTLEVFHVHSYQDQFIQPGWAECFFVYLA